MKTFKYYWVIAFKSDAAFHIRRNIEENFFQKCIRFTLAHLKNKLNKRQMGHTDKKVPSTITSGAILEK